MAIELAPWLLAAICALWAGWQAHRARRALGDADEVLARLGALSRDALIYAQSRERLEELQQFSEATVEGGTRMVQAIHRAIAAIPFGVLEAVPATRDTARIVRKLHDLTADGVYGSICRVNRGVGHGLRVAAGAAAPRESR